MLVLSGYGLDVRVWRGRLRVEDGFGRQRRTLLVHRATGGLARLVILGHTGSISFEAIRWLADIGAAYLQIDADGRVLAAFGRQGTDRAGLRRAQALAVHRPVGLAIAHDLIAQKLHGQRETLEQVSRHVPTGGAADELDAALDRLAGARDVDAIRLAEAQGALAYWQAWSGLAVRFARRDADRIPLHWSTFGSRSSPLTGGPRLAANPANALLNYLYALLEGEATIAARIVGLDPGLGVLHADQDRRDSLAADLMEPVRPLVDRYVLELLATRTFAARDFFETRQGVCRVVAPLTHELVETLPRWRAALGPVVERVADRLEPAAASSRRPLPTPLTEARRSAGRPGVGIRTPRTLPRVATVWTCELCGAKLKGDARRYCAACLPERRAEQVPELVAAGAATLARLRTDGQDPAHGGEAARKRSASQSRRRREELASGEGDASADAERFRRDVLPLIATVPVRQLVAATGLSAPYCAMIRRGAYVPHRRWWEKLRAEGGNGRPRPASIDSPSSDN